ncbi:Hsp20/alpha crystallin family protein [Methanolacinia petrolearia]|uniref:Hsp20/alpha crystallin family protein n=1 Tax=Methanolacinia petrolearia TaxID=54120 RepID=UPI003BA9A9C0
MPNEPNDDLFKNFAKVMEDILSNLSLDENTRFVGCTIITGQGGEPRFIPLDEFETEMPDDIDYEMIESHDRIYITAEISPETEAIPDIDIQPDTVKISIDGKEAVIELPYLIHTGQSFSNIKNGVIDITCEKL